MRGGCGRTGGVHGLGGRRWTGRIAPRGTRKTVAREETDTGETFGKIAFPGEVLTELVHTAAEAGGRGTGSLGGVEGGSGGYGERRGCGRNW